MAKCLRTKIWTYLQQGKGWIKGFMARFPINNPLLNNFFTIFVSQDSLTGLT